MTARPRLPIIRRTLLPLVALVATVGGTFLPWLHLHQITEKTVTLDQLIGSTGPVAFGAALAAGLLAYAALPRHLEWLLIVVCVVAFIVAVGAVALSATILLTTRLASGAVATLDQIPGTATVGTGTYVTMVAAVTMLIGALRLLLRDDNPLST